jgi:hypothetical protein
VVEIGAVELIDRSPTGQTFYCYLCPQRAVPADAVAVHGLTTEFLADKPRFAAIADGFLAFVGDAPLVAHNASFDIAFFLVELNRAAKQPKLANNLPKHDGGSWSRGAGPFFRDESAHEIGLMAASRRAPSQSITARLSSRRRPSSPARK